VVTTRAGRPRRPGALLRTLAVDVGGTGIKASVLDPAGKLERERVRVATPYPLPPASLVSTIEALMSQLPPFDRVSVGFPGMVREGRVLTAPHFVSLTGPGGKVDAELLKEWTRFDLESAVASALGKPTKLANDADMQGAAVVAGKGLEMVVTLGTGFGTALFFHGMLCPHLEFAHHPFRKGETYNEQLGELARGRIGDRRWNKRVARMVETLHALVFYDHLFIGGGNSRRVKLKLDPDVTLVDNSAGLLGGIKLWERSK
jgi:polyphosphate glucokinase